MEWLKDPKNQPKVAIGLSALIVLALVAMYFLYFKGPSDDTGMMAQPEEPPVETVVGPDTVADATSAPPPPATQVASSGPLETWRSDPFMPLGYKPPAKTAFRPRPPILDFPFVTLPRRLDDEAAQAPPELVQPVRRMAGILVNDRIFAIIESNGESEIVQPGDTLKDRLAVVEKIERDKVVLKTKDAKPRYLIVRMAASTRAPSPTSDTTMSPDRPFVPGGTPRTPPRRDLMGPEADFD